MNDRERRRSIAEREKWLCLDFPLRSDFTAQVVIPANMTTAEAERLKKFLESLVIPEARLDVPPWAEGEPRKDMNEARRKRE